jgi:hypothetical protein
MVNLRKQGDWGSKVNILGGQCEETSFHTNKCLISNGYRDRATGTELPVQSYRDRATGTELFESTDVTPLDLCLWGWLKSDVYKRNVATRNDFLARILCAAARIKKHESYKFHCGWGWVFRTYIVNCNGTVNLCNNFFTYSGLVVRVSGYRYRGLGFDPRRYQIFWVVVGLEGSPLSLVSLVRSIEELLV